MRKSLLYTEFTIQLFPALRKYSLFLAMTVLFTSCASVDKTRIPAGPDLQDPEPMEMRAGIEPYYQRVDIIRQQDCTTTTTVNADGSVSTQRNCTPVPYSPMGVFLGNGLFVDVRGNIAIDLVTVTGLRNLQKFTMSRDSSSWFSSQESRVSRDGNQIVLFEPGIFLDDEVRIGITPRGLDLEDNVKLIQDANGIRYEGMEKTTIFGIEIGNDPPEVTINSKDSLQAGPVKIVRASDESILVGRIASFRKNGDQIVMESAGSIFSGNVKHYIYRSQNKMAIVNEDKSLGITMSWDDQSIQIQTVLSMFSYFGQDSTIRIEK